MICLPIIVQGVPFSVSGTVDLLALFRCISCRFKFTTDVTKPSIMVRGSLLNFTFSTADEVEPT